MLLFLFYNLKIITETLPVPNVLLDCVILFYYLTQLELFVAFSKAVWETTARQRRVEISGGE
jgi:hypothetical protein